MAWQLQSSRRSLERKRAGGEQKVETGRLP
jgi:hypothetical protein